ncbi:MAG TPA: alpha/beta hydrolase, partial [Nakamurella sp.]
STLGRILGTAGIVSGVLGAAALGGVTAQRVVVRKYQAAQAALLIEPGDDPGFEGLAADRTYSVDTRDGVALHVEEVGPADAPLTVIFAHGWTLRLGSWHYQRLALTGPGFGALPGAEPTARKSRRTAATRPAARLVFYDHRSHGKSTRAPEGHSTMDFLAADLRSVIDTAAPTGPVVLVGHSMGGMAIFALAAQDPDLFAERIAGVGLVCTGATYLKPSDLSKLLIAGGNPLVKVLKEVGSRYPAIFERGRASNRDAVWMLTRSLGFSRKDVSGALVDYLDEMVSSTPVEVIAEFLPALFAHDQTEAIPALAGIPTMIIAGDQDRMTPLDRSRRIAEVLPDAEIVVAEGSGHMMMMEDPIVTNDALRTLLQRAADGARARELGSRRKSHWSRAGR